MWSVTEAASSAQLFQHGLPLPSHILHTTPSPPFWLLFSHHAAWRRLPSFCPVLTSSQNGSIWLQPIQHRLWDGYIYQSGNWGCKTLLCAAGVRVQVCLVQSYTSWELAKKFSLHRLKWTSLDREVTISNFMALDLFILFTVVFLFFFSSELFVLFQQRKKKNTHPT